MRLYVLGCNTVKKRHMNRVAFLLLVVVLSSVMFTGCDKTARSHEDWEIAQHINLDSICKVSINDVVDSITFLTLPENDGHFIRRITKIRYLQDRIYIYDHGQSLVAVYDSLGLPLFCVASLGQGPGEYVKSACFAVDDKYIYIVDNFSKNLLVYDAFNGNYVKTMKMPFIADDIECLTDNSIAFCNVNMPGTVLDISQPDYRLFITDSLLNIMEKIYPSTGDDPIGQQSYFESYNDTVIFGSVLFDGFTIISDIPDNRISLVTVNFTDGIKSHTDVQIDEIFNYQFISEVPKKCGKYYFIPINYGKGEMIHLLWKEDESKSVLTSDLNYPFYPIGTIKDSFIGFIDSEDTYHQLINLGMEKAPLFIEDKLRQEEIALIFYHMK